MNVEPESNGTILVVDDLPATISFVRTALEETGYTVLVATNGQEALKRAVLTRPDLILLDLLMPGMDGYETCKQLKIQETTKNIPIIFMTVVTETVDKVKGFQLGAVDYLTKPIETEELLARVKTHLTIARLQQELQAVNAGLEQQVATRTAELRAANAQLEIELAERRRAEEALRRSETLLNATQRLAKIGGWDWDVERQTTFWTEEAYRIHGLEPQSSVPGTFDYIDRSLTCYDADDRPLISAAFQRCVQQGDDYDLEFPFTSADGRRKWVRTTAAAVREDGRIIKVVGTLMDITKRKRAEEALRDSEEKLRLTMKAANIGSWEWDVKNDIWSASPIYYTMLGYEPKVGPGDRNEWLERVHPDDRDYVAGKIQDVLTRDFKEHEYEARLRHVDGTYRWQYVYGFGIDRDDKGSVTRMLGIRMDITERKQAEEQIRKLNQQLEQRVADRTVQLQTANQELEAFSYSVSHDLRAPLRHIDGFLELLQQRTIGDIDERSRHYVTNISDAARRMGQLIDDLLAFSRMGRDELSKTRVDLGALVQEVIKEYAPEMQGRAVNWHISNLPTVSGDRPMLRQVIVNLLSNALKFTRPCQSAEIEIGWLPDQGSEVVVFVRDNGVGFDMIYADKLFGVFQRLHHADEFEGTGIGLANVRRIINRHGGNVWAEGQINKGATFYFSLPKSN